MSYLEYRVQTVPSGLRKVLFLNWPLIVLVTAVACIGFVMLYSVAGGSFSPWAEPQMKRFAFGMVVMLAVAMVPHPVSLPLPLPPRHVVRWGPPTSENSATSCLEQNRMAVWFLASSNGRVSFLHVPAHWCLCRMRRSHRASEEELEDALALVRSCHPKPGLALSPAAAEYVVPDVFVRKIDNRWQVEISSSGIPKLSVNQEYAKLLRGNGEHSALRLQLQEAWWLVRSLEIRNETLMKVATCIVSRQHTFLEQGDEAMKPLVLRDVAEAIGMHESTISRVTTSKYMHTPRGVFEFKYFFSSHLSTVDGAEQSSTSVRAKIRKLIGTENPAKPLSDSKIAALLAAEGITVARRTVAKYRDALKIASSSERKIRKPR